MMSKKCNLDLLTKVSKELQLDLKAIKEEYGLYQMSSDKEASDWFSSLPIRNLKDSLNKELGKPREYYSIHDMKVNYDLRKLYFKKLNELIDVESNIRVEKISLLIDNINEIIEKSYED